MLEPRWQRPSAVIGLSGTTKVEILRSSSWTASSFRDRGEPVSANTDTVAAVGYGHAVGSGSIGVAHPNQKEESEFVVIKYLSSADDVPGKTKEPAAR
jgi:hypothetical protein